jgi:signal transduction histidine kinase
MSFASDQDKPPFPLSPNGQRLLDLRDAVFGAWEARVRERVLQARALGQPTLIDTLPAFYDNIAQSISPDYPRSSAVDGSTVATEHGGERARVTSYDHAALIEEYQILRWAIFEVLHREQVVLGHDETHAIHASIDSGIREAVDAFSLVHSGLRERFAAALTHDLRGPLGAAYSGLELILLTNDPTRVKVLAAKALGNIQRMSGMIDELLDTMAFHGGQNIQLALTPFDISEVLKEIRVDAAGTHGARIQVIERVVCGVWDRAALKRVTENLVSNAVKYGSPDKPITIKVDEMRGRMLLTVHNEGPPIPPHEQESIFQMYRRAEAAQRGTKKGWGIGLPYVRAVAESHGGSIGVDSSLERGTTFLVDIPLDGREYQNANSLQQDPDR